MVDAELSREVRRMLRCLDGYWAAWERDEWMTPWWEAFEKYRARVEEVLRG